MKYLLNLFTPDTWTRFREAGANVSGFRERQRSIAQERVKQGDIFICYLTRISRWCGLLQVESDLFVDHSPIYEDPDPFTIRFRVKPIIMLDPESAVPIHEDRVWRALTMTKRHDQTTSHWTGFFRGSLNLFDVRDGLFLSELLKTQHDNPTPYPFTEKDRRVLSRRRRVRVLDRDVEVEVADDVQDETERQPMVSEGSIASNTRESIRYQAKIAAIGAKMGFRVWTPRNDKARVLEHVDKSTRNAFLDQLPLNYDDTTLQTVEQIDVLWLKGRSMARAFEVEHTTAIYSGLLRMADLLALQPNMNICLHIVAPQEKRNKVLREIRRPVFSLLDTGPLYERCSYLSYESVDKLSETRHLSHMSDTIIDEYQESAEE